MKCQESRELRNLTMNQLNERLSELYLKLPNGKRSFERKYKLSILNLIHQVKYEQTLRRKGLRTQGIWLSQPPQTKKITKSPKSLIKYNKG